MKLKSIIIASLTISASILGSCSGPKGWSVSGTIAGAAGQKVALQAFNNNNWYTIDSINISSGGNFEYDAASPSVYPEVLRLSLDGSNIYFPVDSVSHISVKADAASFSRGYTLEGSEAALRFAEIDAMIADAVASMGENAAATDSLLKRNLSQIILSSGEPIAAYYIINKRIAGRPLFDPANRRDLAVIGAVAQAFDANMPDDPRTVTLRNLFLSAKISANPERYESPNTIEVTESGLTADIKAYDNKGAEHSLYDVASKGNIVLLSFTNYTLDASPAYNVILADLYKKYRDRGLEIYQLAFDSDEAEWKQSAVNLPWITVWNAPEDGSATLINYNVSVLPLTYIIGRDGVLRTRVTDPTTLDAEIAKII